MLRTTFLVSDVMSSSSSTEVYFTTRTAMVQSNYPFARRRHTYRRTVLVACRWCPSWPSSRVASVIKRFTGQGCIPRPIRRGTACPLPALSPCLSFPTPAPAASLRPQLYANPQPPICAAQTRAQPCYLRIVRNLHALHQRYRKRVHCRAARQRRYCRY